MRGILQTKHQPSEGVLTAFSKHLLVLTQVFLSTVALPAQAAAARSDLTFEKDVRPILKAHCFHCHGETEKPKGGVDLRLKRFMLSKTDDGTVLVPGKPGESLMFKLVASGEMPKGEKKLEPQQIKTLERWIAAGARTSHTEPESLPRGFHITEQERNFWAFQPIRSVALPKTKKGDPIRSPVDAFVLDKLREQKLNFAPEADKPTLIRRLYLDLLGLPPTPEAVEAFVANTAPNAYETLVNQLLQSPHYGERWARHWLDVAGYADSNGFADTDSVRPHAWHYRDYVIRSFNEDKPINRFITEQLAGDELAELSTANASAAISDAVRLELLTATGFLRMAPDGTADEVPDQNLARNQVVAETIKIVSTSLLGLTTGCAQCHDHRYDPISHVDYHRMRALFEPAYDWKNWKNPNQRLISLYKEEDRKKADQIEVEARQQNEVADKLRKELLEKVFEKEIAKLPLETREKARVGRNTPREKRTDDQRALFKQYPSADVQGALDLYDPEAQKKVQEENAKADKLRATKPAEPMVMALLETPGQKPDTFLFARGDHEQPKQKVGPGEFSVLEDRTQLKELLESTAALTNLPTSGRRLAFARALTEGRHPLVSRVFVNRIWKDHFGRGLVNTPGDFGWMGERPTHPELLDWLASEFVAGGWKLKPFHKLLVMSTTYRQSCVSSRSSQLDSDNHFYARMKLQRLDAETLRDAVLAVSGKLNETLYGTPVPIAQDGSGRVVAGQQKTDGRGDPTIVEPIGDQEFRRSVYIQVRRSLPVTVLETFDAPVMSPNCDARPHTTVTPQSLMMLNDTFILAQSKHFAERLCRESPGNLRAQINRAWKLVFLCEPPPKDLQNALLFIAEQGESIRAAQASEAASKRTDARPDPQTLALASLCQALICQNRFLYVE